MDTYYPQPLSLNSNVFLRFKDGAEANEGLLCPGTAGTWQLQWLLYLISGM